MTNDLKNFLDVETKNITQYAYFVEHQSEEELAEVIQEHNARLINFVLELVEKEVEKLKRTDETQMNEDHVYDEALSDISTIINNLRV